MSLRPLALSLGDPAGIGPEVLLKALNQDKSLIGECLIFAPKAWLLQTASDLGLAHLAPLLKVNDVELMGTPSYSQLSSVGGEWAYQSIVAATQAVVDGQARALVTAPIHKEAMHLAGHDYPGHTELLAELAGGAPVRMMLANDELRTILVTIHMSLRKALDAITQEAVLQTIEIAHISLKGFGVGHQRAAATPSIAVAGLNPHAGEGGIFGREEIDIIAPAISKAKALGIDVQGPFAPDTVFMQARGFNRFDAVIAMYHDQGLIPVKYLGVEKGVNVTLGLPFVRTSPDHGTAFDIAGRNIADASSMLAALHMADQLSQA